MTQVTATIDLDVIDFTSIPPDDAIKAIVEIDLQFQDSEFTLELITALLKSLRSDYSLVELKKEVKLILRTMKDDQ